MSEPESAWPSYAGLAAVAYVIYGVGATGPYLRAQLGLSDAEVGLHSTALAIGLVLAGTLAAGLGRRFGDRAVRGAAIAVIVIALPLLAAAPALVVTLAAAALIGLGAGILLGHINAELGAPGGRLARVRLGRANVWAMTAAFAGPVVVAAGASFGPGWWFGLLPALGLFGVVAFDLRSRRHLVEAASPAAGGGLPRSYWLAWAFLVAAVSIEFSIVFWGATLVERRAGVTIPEATAIGALFLAGMFLGRLALSMGLGAGHDTRRSAAAALALAAVGASLAWVSTSSVLSGLALFIAGLGVASLYPLGIAAALSGVPPGRLTLAGNRLTLASGLAILVAPLALGAIADATGVVAGWALVLCLVAIAICLVLGLTRGPAEASSAA